MVKKESYLWHDGQNPYICLLIDWPPPLHPYHSLLYTLAHITLFRQCLWERTAYREAPCSLYNYAPRHISPLCAVNAAIICVCSYFVTFASVRPSLVALLLNRVGPYQLFSIYLIRYCICLCLLYFTSGFYLYIPNFPWFSFSLWRKKNASY